MFNPKAILRVEEFDDGRRCLIVEDALLDPAQHVEHVASNRAAMRPVDFSVYPGIYLMAPPAVVEGLGELFRQRVRPQFDARRCESLHCRYSMITVPPRALRPYHWLCHVDDRELDPARQTMPASVLYLFKDERLGGTSFYRPNRSAEATAGLFKDARTLSAEAFTQRHGIGAGYMHESNEYFGCIGRVAAKWNRLIFYDGGMLHAADVAAPELLSEDPASGRLTLNGFFTCRRHLSIASPR